MKYKIVLNYTETLIRQAVLRFWWRTVGLGFFVALAILSGLFVFMLVSNQSGWEVGALGAILIFTITFVTVIYFIHYRRSIRKFRSMISPVASLEVSELEFTFSSDIGATTLTWAAISEVLVFENMWLFLFSKAQFSTIPLTGISSEAKDFILSKVKSAGGKIG